MSTTSNPPTQASPSSAAQATHTQSQNQGLSSQVLGQVFNPLRRRVHAFLGGIDYSSSTNLEVLIQFKPHDHQRIKNIVMPGMLAAYQYLEIKIVPWTLAHNFNVAGNYSWMSSVQTYPSTWDEVQSKDMADAFNMAPNAAGGVPCSTVLPFSAEWGVQKIFSPATYVGGAPCFVARVALHPLVSLSTITAGQRVANVYFTAVITLDPAEVQALGNTSGI